MNTRLTEIIRIETIENALSHSGTNDATSKESENRIIEFLRVFRVCMTEMAVLKANSFGRKIGPLIHSQLRQQQSWRRTTLHLKSVYYIYDGNIKTLVKEYTTMRHPVVFSLFKDIDKWDVSRVTNMSGLFANDTLNLDIHTWDVSNVTDMSNMFYRSTFNQPLHSWDTSQVRTMSSMFAYNSEFNQPINGWNVSNVTDMSNMFCQSSSFNQPLDSLNVSNVKKMKSMFYGSPFNQPINTWNVSNRSSVFIQPSVAPSSKRKLEEEEEEG